MSLAPQALALLLSASLAGPASPPATAGPEDEGQTAPVTGQRDGEAEPTAPAAEQQDESAPAGDERTQTDDETAPTSSQTSPDETDDAPAPPTSPDAEATPRSADESAPETERSPGNDETDEAQDVEPEAEPDDAPTTEPEPKRADPLDVTPRSLERGDQDRSHLFGVGLVGGGAAAFALGAGAAGAMGWSLAQYEAADPGARRDTMRNIAIGTGIGAVAYLTTGIVLIAIGARDLRARRYSIGPVVDRRSGGLLLHGRF